MATGAVNGDGATGRFGWRLSAPPAWWLLLLPIVASAATRELWAPDEPRYAEVAREVYELKEPLVMHLCGDLYPDKPPLFYWLSGLFGSLGGWSELSLRIPSLLATIATAWLVARLAERWWDRRTAAWAPALYLTTAMVTDIGGRLQIDPLLTFLCTLALVLATGPSHGRRRDGQLVALAGLATGLAALAKGPVALVNVGLVLAAWAWLGPRGTIRRASPAAWLAASVLAVAPALLWAVAATLAEPRLASELFFGQHLGRITRADRHPGSPWKYFERLPVLLLPWTALVVAALVDACRAFGRRRRGEEHDRGLLLAGLWFAALVVFYSAIPPKRDLYLLPVYPAAALLGARALLASVGRLSSWLALPGPVVVALAGVGMAAAGTMTDVVPGLAWRGPLVGVPLLVGSVVAVAAHRRGDARGWAVAQLASWCLFGVLAALVVFPVVNPLKSARGLAEELILRPERPSAIPCIGVRPEGYRFYGDGRLPTVYEPSLQAALAREGADFLALVRMTEWEAMPATERRGTRVLEERRVGDKAMVVVGAAAQE